MDRSRSSSVFWFVHNSDSNRFNSSNDKIQALAIPFYVASNVYRGSYFLEFRDFTGDFCIKKKRDYSKIAEIQKEIEAASKSLGERGRVVIRYSGTEPLVRIMLEGEKETEIKKYAETIAARFQEKLG